MSGTQAALASFEKSYLAGLYWRLAEALYVNPSRDVFADFRRAAAEVPPRELERIRRIERVEALRLDATHPPTVDRIRLLTARPSPVAKVVLGEGDSRQIDEELERLKPRVLEGLIVEVSRRMDPDVQLVAAPTEEGWWLDVWT